MTTYPRSSCFSGWERRPLAPRTFQAALLRRDGATLAAVGAAVGVTPERVRQAEATVIRHVRVWDVMVRRGEPLPPESWDQYRRWKGI